MTLPALPSAVAARATRRYWLTLLAGALVTATGLGAALYTATLGHGVTGMHNRIVWGLPHVFAIFLIVAASGVLNVASVGSVFGETVYKTRARLSALLGLAMLAGGLMVLMLDLGRPDRVLVAATHYNPTSVFAWNVLLYSGFFAIVGVYLWTLFERRMNRWSRPVGLVALVWRFALTAGTGSIFGFLVARQAYQSALLAPLFIVLSFGWGLAVFLLVQRVLMASAGRQPSAEARRRLTRLLGVFVAASLFLVAVFHLTNLYYARQADFEAFILLGRGQDGSVFPMLFWGGYVLLGSVLPLLLLFGRGEVDERRASLASAGVVAGAFAFLYVFIVGGQAFPQEIFPGFEVSSTFADGQIAAYAPRLPEWLLGLGGVGAALVITLVGTRLFDMRPQDVAAEVLP